MKSIVASSLAGLAAAPSAGISPRSTRIPGGPIGFESLLQLSLATAVDLGGVVAGGLKPPREAVECRVE
jgi:hypothetical protein